MGLISDKSMRDEKKKTWTQSKKNVVSIKSVLLNICNNHLQKMLNSINK